MVYKFTVPVTLLAPHLSVTGSQAPVSGTRSSIVTEVKL